MATLLEPSGTLPPATGLSAPPAPISSRPPIKDSTSTTATTSPRSGAVVSRDASPKGAPTPKRPLRSTTSRMPPTTARPLVPLTERRSHQQRPSTTRGHREALTTASDADLSSGQSKNDITPDGGSAGREGRQFAVSNVGNNGRIYLRPTIRPANQRCPQPQFVFPITPPSTAGLDALGYDRSEDQSSSLHISQWSTPGVSPFDGSRTFFDDTQDPGRPVKHRRALSDSTVHETAVAKGSEHGDFKIVISKPGDDHRPRTMEDVDPVAGPLLDINIPSWRIGTPRFTARGTPVLRGSSYAPTDDFRSSSPSLLKRQGDLNSSHLEIGSVQPSTLAVPTLRFSRSGGTSTSSFIRAPRTVHPSYMANLKIEPAMFDNLTFKPACDDRALVRYSPATSAVTAATPPRLVAEITSPSFLDYELISDFFLTFRAFLESTDLLRMLVARLRWALARDDETGMVVRVRTFVALRHWILNYFMDDFVLDYHLRVTFCELLNDFVAELSQCTRSRKVQLKILGELKKCWRRVCALYWDGPDFDDSLEADIPVSPGGIAGHRDPDLDPSFWDQEDGEPPQLEGLPSPRRSTRERTSFVAEISRAGHIGDSVVFENRPSTPEEQITPDPAEADRNPASPISMTSVDIVSCSFPNKATRPIHTSGSHPLGAHPVTTSSVYNQTSHVATTPRALVGKRVRPAPPTHKRNNSLTDSLRDHGSDKVSFKDQEFLMTVPYAGSLVRGNLLPPGQAFVDIELDDLPNSARQTRTLHPDNQQIVKGRIPAGAMSGHGMRKLLGGVRRALSTRGQGVSPTQGSFINVAPIGPRGATTNRLPGTAIVPQSQSRQRFHGPRPPVRIDVLGAEAAEDFKNAVREEAAAEAERRGFPMVLPNSSSVPADIGYSAAHMDSSTFDSLPQNNKHRPVSDMGITTGSKSIVIVDDTTPFGVSTMHRGTVSGHPSVDAFVDTFRLGGADPTPPTTPPAPSMGGTPRRSSYLLNQHVLEPCPSEDPLPPFVPDLDTLAPGHSARPSEDQIRTSLATTQRSLRHYPPVSFRGSRRNKSTKSNRTHRSLNSMLNSRRYSFGSGLGHSSARSFDATTCSGVSVNEQEPEDPIPPPLRVLRRRPGGDLRAATNVGELDPVSLRRSRSVGSLTAYSESIRSSYVQSPRVDSFGNGEVVSIEYPPQPRKEVFSVGQLAEKPPKRDLSLFSTHSSKPVMRPSFEAEAQKLAQIPDDDEDDGGIESALMKLEGKKSDRRPQDPVDAANIGLAIGEPETHERERRDHREELVMRQTFMLDPDQDDYESVEQQGDFLTPQRPLTEARSFLSETSRESYSSIPILDRGGTDDGRSKHGTQEWTNMSILEGPEEDTTPKPNKYGFLDDEESDSRHQSYDFITKTESIEGIRPGDTAPPGEEEEDQSFLNDDSDLSSELSTDSLDDEDFDSQQGFPSRVALPAHPLGSPTPTPAPKRSPPSPPMTLVQALEMSPPQTFKVPEVHEDQVFNHKPLPLTPETTPRAPYVPSIGSADDQTASAEALRMAPKPEPAESAKYTAHLPFILAFDSEILAQQFTLIEKDALNEIDWKELIDMNWKNATNNDSRSWVGFLRNTDAHGVEVVIARFNIMVKWAISEIVMTQHAEERARCIAKFLHIATHCRRYRNFATLAQLTIALSSNEVSRLTKTWALLPPHDHKTMRDLENLVTPMRNFYNLRAEMEVGSDSGCIPFVGIYTHDLLYNAQRPSEIAGSPTTPPLINFERCRIAAAVVKTLLRLLEASTRYKFQPIEGITERCLWMSALSDEEIRRHSEILE
ncbi:Guanine nucleotide exchange factor lte1 [Neonectria magnoliae]|uniref:Guanine nucleotide exchange factor lte1 n=1 Tax=Neonectria magnoliae TaxID=2732573 RepID=A0ABR1IG99_9HYPO